MIIRYPVNVLILFANVRKNCKLTSTLNSYCHCSLMLSACACNSAGKDLAALRDKSLKLAQDADGGRETARIPEPEDVDEPDGRSLDDLLNRFF